MALGPAAVILGAGASFGSVDILVERVVTEARPPLTAGLFDEKFGQFLAPYRDASMLVSTIKSQLRAGRPLETILRDFSETSVPHRRAQFMQVPLYLRDLFAWISDAYTANPTNYAHLAHELISEFERVIFITLNYDRLLEKVLTVPSLGGQPTSIDDYDRSSWLLAKLHGSVEWVRRSREVLVAANVEGGTKDGQYLALLAELAKRRLSLDELLEGDVSLMPPGGSMINDGYFYYPAIVIPVEGKYGFVCPATIIRRLELALSSCSHVLIIGASGKDADLTNLLAQSLGQVVNYHFVGGAPDSDEAAQRFDRVPQLRQAPMPRIHRDGFSGFLTNGFAQFMEDARLLGGR